MILFSKICVVYISSFYMRVCEILLESSFDILTMIVFFLNESRSNNLNCFKFFSAEMIVSMMQTNSNNSEDSESLLTLNYQAKNNMEGRKNKMVLLPDNNVIKLNIY